MKSKISNALVILALFFVLWGCGSANKQENEVKQPAEDTPKKKGEKKGKVRLRDIEDSPAYENASLKLNEVDLIEEEGRTFGQFDFEVNNFELGVQTEGGRERRVLNTKKGQYVRTLISNKIYSSHYEESFKRRLGIGNRVVLSFLSRSYHESIKNPDAYWLDVIKVGEPDSESDRRFRDFDLDAPLLFYNMPNGTYKGKHAKRILLDFYLVNTTLSPEGNKVKVTIDGRKIFLDEWKPMYIVNAPKGELEIRLDLVDSERKLIPGPYNKVKRTIIVE